MIITTISVRQITPIAIFGMLRSTCTYIAVDHRMALIQIST